ncbi:cell division protein FtsQ/DivIB [Luteibaculum oceani]|uniref:Cell division protein FtsQ n=1 Tax=Luteibaculum oceani TaxID=1294296 RepID=A0A5C6UZQ7_9FLAO|nr:hypothetical protein [Luteibaculum oceani]TXC78872.1 hypothetical protein FRX97_06570 [Luteibaculum oceani]
MKKPWIKIVATWVLMPLVLVLILAFNAKKHSELACNAIKVQVDPREGLSFITKRDVETKILSRNENLIGKPISEIDFYALEQLLLEIPHVKHVKVYTSIRGDIHVKLKQKKPLARIIYPDGNGFYLNAEGEIMPLSKNFTARVLTVNGNISRKYLKDKSLEAAPLLASIYKLAKQIDEDEFLKAQLQQLYVNENQEFEFVPRVGNHIIEFGDDSESETKFENLKIFYLQGLSYKGWNRYQKVSLKFKDQVVCTKK